MKLAVLGGLAVAALSLSTAAIARDQLGQRDTVTVDAGRAYILFRTPTRADVRFLREPDAAEVAAWRAERQTAFERARARYERSLRNWERDVSQCRGDNAASAYCRARGPRPEPVTEENFAYPPPEMDNFVDVTRGRYFERSDSGFTYLRAVEPGSYVLYGQVVVAQAVAGVCLCMGSVRFEARAGEIVDIGELNLAPDEDSVGTQGRFTPNGRAVAPYVVPAEPGGPQPARLAGLPVVQAELSAADRMPNYFGILIDRLAPVPGVLAYDRDRVIDVRTHAAGGASR